MMLEDRAALGSEALVKADKGSWPAANKDPNFAGVFTLFTRLAFGLCRYRPVKAEKVGLTPTECIFDAQVLSRFPIHKRLHYLGRTYQVRCRVMEISGAFAGCRPPEGANTSGENGAIGDSAQLKSQNDPITACALQSFPAAECAG